MLMKLTGVINFKGWSDTQDILTFSFWLQATNLQVVLHVH